MPRPMRRQSTPDRVVAQKRNVAGLTYAGSQLRAHCPLCGMMANVERFEEGPYEVDAQMQYYGGSIRQHYEDAPQYLKDVLRMILQELPQVRTSLLQQLGEEKTQRTIVQDEQIDRTSNGEEDEPDDEEEDDEEDLGEEEDFDDEDD